MWLQLPPGSIIVLAGVKACLLLLVCGCTFGAYNAKLVQYCHSDGQVDDRVTCRHAVCKAPVPRLLAGWTYGVTMQEMSVLTC